MTIQEVAPAITAPFTFSQSSLEEFDRCPRRFFLRYVERLEWPTTGASPLWERNLRVRQRFHRLLHQHHVGVNVDAAIEAEPAESDLRVWWDAFRQYPPPLGAGETYAEVTLSVPLGNHWLTARLDLLAVHLGQRLTIVDWKTGQTPAVDRLRDGWQTLVYTYALTTAGAPYWGGEPPPPEAIRMIYWFADYPASPVVLDHDAARQEAARVRLAAHVERISTLPPRGFSLCEDESICQYCPYAGYCRRAASRSDAMDDIYPDEEAWDWSDVPEYEY